MSGLTTISLIGSSFIGSSGSRVLIALLVAAAAGLLVGAIFVLFAKREAKVERQLAGYELPDPIQGMAPGGEGGPGSGGSETAAVQTAVAFTSRMADRAGLLARTELLLEQADVPVRAAELLFYTPAFAVIAFLLLAV